MNARGEADTGCAPQSPAPGQRLIVVSNRVADRGDSQSGGLATALKAALATRGGLWFGWSGHSVETDAECRLHRCRRGAVDYATLDLTRRDSDAYYAGFANQVLWPLFHYRPDLVEFQREHYAGYRRVNRLLAAQLAQLLNSDDLIWIHDYHLLPLAADLRALGVANRIGFFLHTPLPAAELMRSLPCHEELLDCLLACDVIGLQTEPDLHALKENLAQAEVASEDLPEIAVFPISIATAALAAQAERAADTTTLRRLRASLGDRVLMIGVDRLDYSKGLPARFAAFGRLLEREPRLRRRVTLLQIAPPTRTQVPEYQRIRAELEQLTGHINGLHAAPDWIPIRYVNRAFPQRLLAGYYRAARVGVVTPLRDGMNLVAKEYVASQDPADPGVLVLSRFAGAAQELQAALQVNPLDQDDLAEAMARALRMPLAERQARWQAMMTTLRGHTIDDWCRQFLERLAAPAQPWQRAQTRGQRGSVRH